MFAALKGVPALGSTLAGSRKITSLIPQSR